LPHCQVIASLSHCLIHSLTHKTLHPPSTHLLCCCCSARLTPQVKNYFNTDGFNRWQKIYGETDEVNKVQLDIRQGHAQTVDKVLGWLDAEGGVQGTTVADAGCGTGAQRGCTCFRWL
jgi:hypothetical protein